MPGNLQEAHKLLLKPEVSSLLQIIAINSIVENQAANMPPEACYYMNRAVITFLADIQDFKPNSLDEDTSNVAV